MHFKMGMFCGSVMNTVDFYQSNSCLMEKGAQTLSASCRKARPKNSPHCRPPSWGCGTTKFNQLEVVTTFTYKPSLVMIDARNFELSW